MTKVFAGHLTTSWPETSRSSPFKTLESCKICNLRRRGLHGENITKQEWKTIQIPYFLLYKARLSTCWASPRSWCGRRTGPLPEMRGWREHPQVTSTCLSRFWPPLSIKLASCVRKIVTPSPSSWIWYVYAPKASQHHGFCPKSRGVGVSKRLRAAAHVWLSHPENEAVWSGRQGGSLAELSPTAILITLWESTFREEMIDCVDSKRSQPTTQVVSELDFVDLAFECPLNCRHWKST